MHRYLWLVAALIVGCGHHSTHGVPTDGGADVTLYGAAFPEQVPLAALTKSGATDGQVATWSATAATWAPGTGGGFTAGGDLSGTSTSQEVNTLKSGTWTVSTGGPGLVGSNGTSGAFVTQNAPTSDLATQTFSVAAMPAYTGAATNLTGGELDLIGGAGATTNGTGGNVIAKVSAPSGSGTEAFFGVERGGSNYFAVGALNGFAGAYTALWMNPGITPTTSNYQFNTNGTDIQINGNPVYILADGVTEYTLSGFGFQLGSSTLDMGGGNVVLGLTKAVTSPSSAPSASGDGILWSDTGGLKDWQNTGLLTTIVPSASGTLGTQYRSAPAYVGYISGVGSAGAATLTIPIPTQTTYGVTCSLNASVTARTKTAGATGALGDSTFREIANAFWESAGGTITKIAASDVSLLSTTVSSTSLASASFATSVSGSNIVLTYTNPTNAGVSVDATITADLTCN